MSAELMHHGILGQKWGIRRYQNYDGTYTQKGLKRYREAKDTYEKSKSELDELKVNNGSKTDISNKQNEVAQNKRYMNTVYDHLKDDKKADQGRELYQQGKTITNVYEGPRGKIARGSAAASSAISATILGLSAKALSNIGGDKVQAGKIAATAALGIAAAWAPTVAMNVANRSTSKKLKAYYSHTTPVDTRKR